MMESDFEWVTGLLSKQPKVDPRFFCRGFTLVELMVTLTVASILVALAIPSFGDLLNNTRMRSAADSLSLDLTYARTEAIKRVVPVVLCKSLDGAACSTATTTTWANGRVIFVDTNRNNLIDSGESVIAGRSGMTSGLSVSASNYSNYITYVPDGSSNTNGSFTLQDSRGSNYARTLCIASTGRVKQISGSSCS